MTRTRAGKTRQVNPGLAHPRWPCTCVLVADGGGARLLEATRAPTLGGRRGAIRLDEVLQLDNPAAHLPGRALVTDRTGRVFDSGGRTGRGPKSRARHGAQSDYDPHDIERERFAKKLALRLDTERRRIGIEQLIVIAAPRFLGELRRQLSAATRRVVTREVASDLQHAGKQAVRSAAFPAAG